MVRVIAAIQRAPGIAAVSTLSTPPLIGAASVRRITARLGDGGIRTENVWPEIVSAGYFAAMGTRITRGRAFSDSDVGADSGLCSRSTGGESIFRGRGSNRQVSVHQRGKAEQQGSGQPACRVIGVAEDAHFKDLDGLSRQKWSINLARGVRARCGIAGSAFEQYRSGGTGCKQCAERSPLREACRPTLAGSTN